MFVIVMVNVVTIYVCDCACSDIYVYVYVVTYMFVVVNVVTYMFVYAPMYICMYVRCACSDIACSVAGITSDANVLLAELRASAQRYRLSYGRPIPVEELVIQMCDVKHAYTQYGGLRPFGVSFLYAGWDPVHSLQLYLSDPSGNYSGWKATCIGYNASAAMALLKQEYPAGDAPQPTREQALDLAVRVLAKTMDTGKLTVDKVLFLLFRPVSFLSSLHTAYCILHSAYCILHTQSHYDTPLYSIPCVLCVVYCVVCCVLCGVLCIVWCVGRWRWRPSSECPQRRRRRRRRRATRPSERAFTCSRPQSSRRSSVGTSRRRRRRARRQRRRAQQPRSCPTSSCSPALLLSCSAPLPSLSCS